MGCLVFVGILNNWSWSYPKSCCLSMRYVLLAGLPGLALVEEEVGVERSLTSTDSEVRQRLRAIAGG